MPGFFACTPSSTVDEEVSPASNSN